MSNSYNFELDQGSTFQKIISIKDANSEVVALAGYDARMTIRSDYGAVTALCELTVANSRVAINTTTNQITLLIAASVTKDFAAAKYVYDFEVIAPDGVVKKYLKGTFEVFAEVTT